MCEYFGHLEFHFQRVLAQLDSTAGLEPAGRWFESPTVFPHQRFVRGVSANGSMVVGRTVNRTKYCRLECLFGFVIKADVVGTPFAVQRSGRHCLKLVEWTERYFAARTADFVMLELSCTGGTCTRSG